MASNSPEEPSDIWYTSATKCGNIKGFFPTISIASDESAVMVYAKYPGPRELFMARRDSDGEEAFCMFYTVGTLKRGKLTWGSQKAFGSVACSFPSVAVANGGTVVLALICQKQYMLLSNRNERENER